MTFDNILIPTLCCISDAVDGQPTGRVPREERHSVCQVLSMGLAEDYLHELLIDDARSKVEGVVPSVLDDLKVELSFRKGQQPLRRHDVITK